MYFSLTYVSSAREEFTKPELLKLLNRARAYNHGRGITGILLYRQGNILQVLEGQPVEVMTLYARIERDRRHRGLITLLQRNVEEREFGDWSMAFRDMDDMDLRYNPAYSEIMNTSFDPEDLPKDSEVLKLIATFHRNMVERAA